MHQLLKGRQFVSQTICVSKGDIGYFVMTKKNHSVQIYSKFHALFIENNVLKSFYQHQYFSLGINQMMFNQQNKNKTLQIDH